MITVLMAACNGEAYISQQLDSILNQSRGDIRILVSDDGSTDGTRAILTTYEDQFPERIAVVRRETPSGGAARHFLWLLSAAARRAQELEGQDLKGFMEAEYFMLSDQDDCWFPQKAEVLLGKMQQLERGNIGRSRGSSGVAASNAPRDGQARPVLVHSDMQVVDRQLHVMAPSFFRYQKISPERCSLSQLLVQNNITGGAVMMNRPLVALLKKSPAVCLMHDSWIGLVAACFGTIGWVDEPLYAYRQHDSNTLGAEKGDNLEGAVKRIQDGSQAREQYRLMFGQARCLLKQFGGQLTDEQRRVLNAFLRLPQAGLADRARITLKYGFTKNTWLRTIGQIVMMNR